MNQTLTIATSAKNTLRDALIVFAGSIFLALLSKISIPLFFTPIPLTFQNNAVLLLALLLGKRGLMSAMLFTSYGFMGLPVFSSNAVGFAILVGPTGGYILGYLIAAYLVAHLADRQKAKTPFSAFLIMSLGSCVIMFLGCLHLSFLIGIQKAIILGVFPFIFTNLVKTLLAARLTKTFKWTSK